MRHFILFQGYYFNTAITSALTEVWNPACSTIHLLIYPKTATQSCPFETLQDYLWDAALCCNTGYRQTACVLLDVISENNDNYLATCICEVFQMLPYAPLHLYIFPSYFLLGGGADWVVFIRRGSITMVHISLIRSVTFVSVWTKKKNHEGASLKMLTIWSTTSYILSWLRFKNASVSKSKGSIWNFLWHSMIQ